MGLPSLLAKQSKPEVVKPIPILPTLPIPDAPPTSAEARSATPIAVQEELSTQLELILPSTTAYSRSATPIARRFGVGNSIAVQEELSSQLEMMAAQLKRNAIHFSTSLAKDQAVVEDAQQKLEGNYDEMMKERVRLRDHRGKSGSTTCMVLAIVALVLVLFIFMISIIRFS